MQQHGQSVGVVLDAGHGGSVDLGGSTCLGTRGPGGTLEKDVTLALSKRIVAHLGGGARLTREGDENVPIAQRIATASRHGARVFVSLHANAGAPALRGPEIYVHDRARRSSLSLAQALQEQLAHFGNASRGVFAANLAILTPDRHAPSTAACLLEVDYLSSRDGERALRDPGLLDRTARAVAEGIRRYMGTAEVSDATGSDPDEGDGEPLDPDTATYGGVIRRFSIDSLRTHTKWRPFDAPGGPITVTAEARWEGTPACFDGGNKYKVEFDTGDWVWMPIGEWRPDPNPIADTCAAPLFARGTQTVTLSSGRRKMRLRLDNAWTDMGGVHVRNGSLSS
jgi:N-acetylmuramoyl-L-alanine amidase